MTKKELNKIKRAAFEEFKNQYTAQEFNDLFAGMAVVCVWKVVEGSNVKILVLNHQSQMNLNTLQMHGFSENAECKKLFFVNRMTKTVGLF